MAKKINQRLLNEELKKFRLLSEYSFYTEEPKKKDDGDLILGSGLDEADEDPNAAPEEAPADDSKTAANQEAGAEDTGADDSENMFGTSDETGSEDTGAEEAPADAGTRDMGAEEVPADAGADATGEEEVDVDVTQLVKGSEEAKQSAQDASEKTSELLAKFSELEQRVSAMDSITSKIQDLEQEIVKRNPTPVEKLEMRSMHSFPYNIKLTDYWKDVEGYDPTEEKPEEYVLTKDDVGGGYDPSIKDTFNVPEDYEEEDISA